MVIQRWLCVAAVCLFTASSSFAAQSVSGPTDRLSKPYLTPQQLVVVDGKRRLNLYCTGSGKPTVLFDGGGGASAAEWRFVQAEVGKVTRSCSYDRAGFGFSDPPKGPSDARAAVEDIHRLVAAAKLGPVVYVGESLSGLYGVLLQATYPRDILAEVLVDPSFANQDFASLEELSPNERKNWLLPDYKFLASMKKCAERKGDLPKDCLLSQSDPRPNETALAVLDHQQVSRRSYIRSWISSNQSFLPPEGTKERSIDQQQVEDARPQFGNKPLVVLTRDGSPSYWKAGHDKLASLSRQGRNVVVPKSTHSMVTELPKPVIGAVTEIVQKIRRASFAGR